MERLTYDSGNQWEIKGVDGTPCDEVCKKRGLAGCSNCPIQNTFDRLAAYENTDLEPEEILDFMKGFERAAELAGLVKQSDIDHLKELLRAEMEGRIMIQTPNPPLTLEELREMDGEPVWVIHPQNKFEPCWMLVMVRCNFVLANWQVCNFSDYGHTWLAYRRNPEEGTTCSK